MTPEERARKLVVTDDIEGLMPEQMIAVIAEAIKAAVAAEREACARVVESWPEDGLIPATLKARDEAIAAAIRERT